MTLTVLETTTRTMTKVMTDNDSIGNNDFDYDNKND